MHRTPGRRTLRLHNNLPNPTLPYLILFSQLDHDEPIDRRRLPQQQMKEGLTTVANNDYILQILLYEIRMNELVGWGSLRHTLAQLIIIPPEISRGEGGMLRDAPKTNNFSRFHCPARQAI